MTESEAIEKLRAYHKCQRLQVKGIYEDCNEKLCDNCDLCYAQGNTGEHIKSIEIAIQALEKQIPKKPDCIEDKMWCCPVCDNNLLPKWIKYPTRLMPKSEGLPHCMSCGQAIDWGDGEHGKNES